MESDQEIVSETYQKPEEQEEEINPEEYYGKSIDKLKNIPLRKLLPEGYLKNVDSNFRYFCKQISKNLRQENYEIIGITGFPGTGKSQITSIMSCLIDPNFSFGKNINFIPTATQVEKDYLKLPMYSALQIDEASRSVHKHKWYEKTQQKLTTLYDTEREGHYICTSMIMPRFTNFAENFRNFFIKYWINIICRGVVIVYRRDEDKDTKDPWNIEENVKLKKKFWGNKRIFDRNTADIIRMEQKTKNYWFYFTIPEIPKEVWSIYKSLKKQSRIDMRESEAKNEMEGYRERLERIKMERWKTIVKLKNEGLTVDHVAVQLGLSAATIKRDLHDIRAYVQVKGEVEGLKLNVVDSNNNIYNLLDNDKVNKTSLPDIKVQNVKPEDEQWDINGLIKKD